MRTQPRIQREGQGVLCTSGLQLQLCVRVRSCRYGKVYVIRLGRANELGTIMLDYYKQADVDNRTAGGELY